MSRELRGVAASPGTAIAPPWRYEPHLEGPSGKPERPDELDLASAAERAAGELQALADGLRREGHANEAAILEAQALMARDDELLGRARSLLADGMRAAEAVVTAGEEVARGLEALGDEFLAARGSDVRDVSARIARAVTGYAVPRLERRSIAIAEDLPPSVTAELDRSLLAGIALEAGSRTAHAAILARALGIPAVVGVPGLLYEAAAAREIAIDGGAGRVLVDAAPHERAELAAGADAMAARVAGDALVAADPLATRDGHRIVLAANVAALDEVPGALAAGAEEIGLFRTEFLFMGRPVAPDEEEQLAAYREVLGRAEARRVVFRILDVGGDKAIPYLRMPREANPFLGIRALRVARLDPRIIVTQLRALFRAGEGAAGRLAVMAPMIGDLADLALFRQLLDQAASELDAARIDRGGRLELGVMIEVPSSVQLADQLAAGVDFFSIGTNDLTQYLLAADRTNPLLAEWQDPLHPAVLRAIALTVDAAAAHGTRVGVCGEMAADPLGAIVLVGLGVHELSTHPSAFGELKRTLANVTTTEAAELARRCLDLESAPDVRRAASDMLNARREAAPT